ncbi:dopaminechrome tautomerase [Eurosta solidaginis]|uniref:dopaminechrome tautomerase n=1 Tax=Eurosta solidaginis TaxID=178769 RepID=UPI0035307814
MHSIWLYLICVVFSIGESQPQYSYSQKYERKLQNYHQCTNKYKELTKVYEARNLEFGFPSEFERQTALLSGRYQPDIPLPIDVDVYYLPNRYRPEIFLTIPRFGRGVPYSLATLTDVVRPNGPELQPFPSYDWHSTHGGDCNGLTSVYRIQVDSCGNMWILDSGEIEFVQYCAPQILVLDIARSTVLHRYRLPLGIYKPKISRFVTPYVDIADPAPWGSCQKAFVYMADPTGNGFVVYDVSNRRSWRIENKYTYPDPDFGTHTIAGESFELMDGTFSFAATPHSLGIRRMLYFHSLSNDAQIAIPLHIVNNQSYWSLNDPSSGLEHFILLGKRGVQCGIEAMTAQGVLLCGHLAPIGIFGWNISTPYTFHNRALLAENPETLQFVSGLKVRRNLWGQDEVWIVSNRLQRSFGGNLNFNETNYRILKCGVVDLLIGRPC